MRAFFFGLLVAAVVGWWAGVFGGAKGAADTANAASANAASGAPLTPTGAPLDRVLGIEATESVPPPPAVPASGRVEEPPPPVLAELLPRLLQRDATAFAAGWGVLAKASLAVADRQQVTNALAPTGDDFPTLLTALGANNMFLHSAEGRGLATKVATAAFSLADAEAVPAGTKLLELMARGRILKADAAPYGLVSEVYKQHLVRVDRWLCDPANVTGARSHTIGKGETLSGIATKFRKEKILVEEGSLAILNRIHNANLVKEGQKIRVPVAPIHAVVEKRSFTMAVYVGENLLRLYWIGHGENDRTPNATFTIGVKQPRPQWTSPDGQVYGYGDAKNILGEYFIKFLNDTYIGFGAHGTTMPDTIRTMSSMGCIRMLDPDIAELFRLLPMGAKVEVRATESLR